MDRVSFYLPTRPFSVLQAVNRAAIATGSARNAMVAHDADYNGHRAVVSKNAYGSYGAHYTWAGLNWLARRATFLDACAAAKREYDRGALGASAVATLDLRELDEHAAETALTEARAALQAAGWQELPEGADLQAALSGEWWTPLHAEAFHAVRAERERGIPVCLLWEAASIDDYRAKVATFVKTRRDQGISAALRGC
jgi:hypothetical protein